MAFSESEAKQSNDFIENIHLNSEREFTKNINKMNSGYISLYGTRPQLDVIPTGINAVIGQSGYGTTSQALLNEGFDSVVDESFNLYKRMFNESFTFTDESLDRLGVWKGQSLNRFNKLIAGSNDDVTNLFVNATLTDMSDDVFKASIEVLTTTLINQTVTEATTATAGYYRNSNVLLALDNGLDQFIYSGPFGGNIRPFCRDHVGQVKTITEWDEFDNGQLNPVSVYQGGYNCRHDLIAVLDESDAVSDEDQLKRRKKEDNLIKKVLKGAGKKPTLQQISKREPAG